MAAKSQRGVAVGLGVARSAEVRKCPACKRHAALVRGGQYGVACRWCAWEPTPGKRDE